MAAKGGGGATRDEPSRNERKHQSSGGPGPVGFSRQGWCGLLPSLPKSKVAEFMQVLNVYLQIFEDNMRGTQSGRTDYSLPACLLPSQ